VSIGVPVRAAATAGMDGSNAFVDPAQNGHVAEKHVPNSIQPDGRAKCSAWATCLEEAGRLPFEPDRGAG